MLVSACPFAMPLWKNLSMPSLWAGQVKAEEERPGTARTSSELSASATVSSRSTSGSAKRSACVAIKKKPADWNAPPVISGAAYSDLERLVRQLHERDLPKTSAVGGVSRKASGDSSTSTDLSGSFSSLSASLATSFSERPSPGPFAAESANQNSGPTVIISVTAGASLPEARAEVDSLQELLPGPVSVHENPAAGDLSAVLRGARHLHMASHMRKGCATFVRGARPEVVTFEPVVLAAPPCLERAVLNACYSASLAKLLHARGGERSIFCWRSRVEDEAARIFGEAVWLSLLLGRSDRDAFEAGRFAVTADTKPVVARDGGPARSQKFTLRDPDESEGGESCVVSSGIRLVAAGVP